MTNSSWISNQKIALNSFNKAVFPPSFFFFFSFIVHIHIPGVSAFYNLVPMASPLPFPYSERGESLLSRYRGREEERPCERGCAFYEDLSVY